MISHYLHCLCVCWRDITAKNCCTFSFPLKKKNLSGLLIKCIKLFMKYSSCSFNHSGPAHYSSNQLPWGIGGHGDVLTLSPLRWNHEPPESETASYKTSCFLNCILVKFSLRISVNTHTHTRSLWSDWASTSWNVSVRNLSLFFKHLGSTVCLQVCLWALAALLCSNKHLRYKLPHFT